ncbi:MAG TPA: hypothetical protein VFX28_10975 [Methylomirabilota bacterium]|nr:hypothetical protein [Methylomirabilota bacterium]
MRIAAVAAATLGSGTVALAIVAGSRGLRDFDVALVPYALAAVFAAGAAAYRYVRWLTRPPTWRCWEQAWRLWRARPLRATAVMLRAGGSHVAAQRFIGRRSRSRWLAHLCLSWGTLLALAITLPLVFGWMRFETPPDDLSRYRVLVLGVAAAELRLGSVAAFVAFNALNASAVVVLAGVGLALRRRLTDPGLRAGQRFGHDILPLLLLLAVAASGLGLTVSARALGGDGFGVIAVAHTAAVAALLLSLPFGKLFHVFQRGARLGVAVYRDAAAREAPAECVRCGQPYTSRRQRDDVEDLLRAAHVGVGLGGICPRCRRCLWSLAQGRLLGRG